MKTITSDAVKALQFNAIIQAMRLEIDCGIYVGRGVKPFHIAHEQLGVDAKFDEENRCINKSDVYKQACTIDVQDAIAMFNNHSKKPKTKVVTEGFADGNKLFDVLGGFFKVPQKDICDLLLFAFEGGSNYWYFIYDNKRPTDPNVIPKDFKLSVAAYPWGDGEISICNIDDYYENNQSIKPTERFPNGVDIFTLDEAGIKKGLDLFAQNRKEDFLTLVKDGTYNLDGNTGDLFLQYCLFGEIVYG